MLPFFGDITEKIFSDCDISSLACWRYIEDIFMISQHGEKELKKFLDILNSSHPTITFIANYSRDKIIYLHVEVIKKGNLFVTDVYVNPLTPTNIFMLVLVTLFVLKNQYLTAKPEGQTGFVQKVYFSMNKVTI